MRLKAFVRKLHRKHKLITEFPPFKRVDKKFGDKSDRKNDSYPERLLRRTLNFFKDEYQLI
ncbi:hypothetical protein DC345_30450 [Paenibacillus taichungensis]|uniref:Uncharacterized protein n=1 Tax=Paenibacillus taichungensis TaxID=484184 RepID=A0A329QBI9_9BACL|nr:hypothetical protein DC345_30450 [Paenibacillus taichungensis]